MPTQAKRIHSVTVRQMVDDSPDTSWLGEYSNSRTSRFSIDRRHALDCASQTSHDTVAKLERIISYLDTQRLAEAQNEDPTLYDSLDGAQDLLISAQDEALSCDCDNGGDASRGEYRYFNPSSNYVDNKDKIDDGLTDEQVREYVRRDYERMERLNNGDWYFMVVSAEAEIQLSGSDITQTITSGCIGGIESDSDKSYLDEIGAEQLSELRQELRQMGFSTRAISTAFKGASRE